MNIIFIYKIYYFTGRKRTSEYKENIINLLRKYDVQTVLDAACGTG